MGLFDFFRRMKDPVRGQAQVVSCSANTGGGIYTNCSMQLVVQAEGVPATPLRISDMVHAQKWPWPGMTLPVTVDQANPERVKIEWDEVEKAADRAARNADALAAMMRGEATSAMPFSGASVNVVDLRSADPDDEVDEQLARLEKLGRLRDAGVLTPDEFELQKRRILES